MFKKKDLTAASLGIRMVMGGYLLYLAYSLFPAIQKAPDTKEMLFWITIVALFFLVGSLALFFSVKALLKGEYSKGNQEEESESDTDTENDTTIEGAAIEESNIEDTLDKEKK